MMTATRATAKTTAKIKRNIEISRSLRRSVKTLMRKEGVGKRK